MKLLIDHNLSFRLASRLAELFPDSVHVRDLGLERANDLELWNFARENGFVIVSKDADFHQLSFAFGHPPKVVWVRRGNCSRREIESLLRSAHREIYSFAVDSEAAFLAID